MHVLSWFHALVTITGKTKLYWGMHIHIDNG